MKTNKLFFAVALTLSVLTGCQQKLPYDLEGTTHGVVINIRKAAGSSTTLSTDMNDGDYKVVLSIPEQQGDYSMLKEAQIMAVYTDGKSKSKQYAKVITGITTFPYTTSINIKDVCSKLHVTKINIGDRIEFTPCVSLTNGMNIDGWSPIQNFNNTKFTSWSMADGSPFAYKVAYTAFAPFHKEKFQGNAVPFSSDYGVEGTVKVTQVTDLPEAKWIPAGVADSDLIGLVIEGDMFWGPAVMEEPLGEVVKLWINTQDYTLIIPDQTMCPTFAYPGLGEAGKVGYLEEGEGEVDTLNDSLWFYFVPTFGDGYWFGGGFNIELQF